MNLYAIAVSAALLTTSGVRLEQGPDKRVVTQVPAAPTQKLRTLEQRRAIFLAKLNQLLDLLEAQKTPGKAVEILFASTNYNDKQDAVIVIIEDETTKKHTALMSVYHNEEWSMFPDSFE